MIFSLEVLEIIKSNGYDKDTLALWVVKHCMTLDLDGKHELISYLIAESYSERYAWNALELILETMHIYNDEENNLSEVCSYPHFVDWVIQAKLGKLTPPRKNSGKYRKNYFRRWGYVHCTCHLIKQGITAGRNRKHSQGLGEYKNKNLDKLCAAGIVADTFNHALSAEIARGEEKEVTPSVVLKYFNLAIKGELRPYFWGPKSPDIEVLNTLDKKTTNYYREKEKRETEKGKISM